MKKKSNTALGDLRVLDLSRVLAGPSCTQILGDMGAQIIKVEKPGTGDDTRKWGPPYARDKDGNETTESAYYLSANRNKQSIAIDITQKKGQELVKELATHCDILIENFKTGSLARYGLDYASLKQSHPHLIYCSITGFGQTGPLASEPGYDFLAQAMGGLMAITGAPNGEPMKAGVALSDILTGLYAATGILGALHARKSTGTGKGTGQHIDLSLVDCTMAAMTNIAQYYLTSGALAPRLGNAHSTIVPYQVFDSTDGHVIIAVGNDTQFARFAAFLGHEDWADNPDYATNPARVKNRAALVPQIAAIIATQTTSYWIEALEDINIPVAPVQDMAAALNHPQSVARNMKITMDHAPSGQAVDLVGSPLKLSDTPVSYRRAPPSCGQDTHDVLREILNLDEETIARLKAQRIAL